MPPRLLSPREIRDTRYSADATVRSWYKSARWQALRLEVLVRDLYTCRQTGVLLTGKHPAPNSPVVDHVVPHRGDERLFWDIDNLQAVSKAYHDSDKRKMEMQQNGIG
jgi:5-methylcytosine-specific restriction protein A